MRNYLSLTILFLFLQSPIFSQNATTFQPTEIARWEKQAKNVEIIRDNWDTPHVYGKTDADAVFGMLYVQCEDDFHRLEHNYIDALGRMSEAFGANYLYHDLRAAMFMDETTAKAYYAKSPAWMKKLCDAFADGINYYLHTHPEVKPKLITRFHNWMPFYFSEGSIGGDITRISLRGLENFYGNESMGFIDDRWALEEAPTGSNGFAIHPSKSISGNSLFLINPHTSYYFRSEVHINSDQGLKALLGDNFLSTKDLMKIVVGCTLLLMPIVLINMKKLLKKKGINFNINMVMNGDLLQKKQ